MILPPAPKSMLPRCASIFPPMPCTHCCGGEFEKIPDHRGRKCPISLPDALMSAFGMFSLKDPSLLAFEERRNEENMRNLFGIARVPSDTHMREILDPVEPRQLRPLFNAVFRQLQRGKALESFVFYQGCYLLSLDGTGYFSSSSIHCDSCLEKVNKQTGEDHLSAPDAGRGDDAPQPSGSDSLGSRADREARRQREERLRAERGQTVAAAHPPGTSPSEVDRRGGRIGQQRPAYPRTAGPATCTSSWAQNRGIILPVRQGARRLRGGPGDDDFLDGEGDPSTRLPSSTACR